MHKRNAEFPAVSPPEGGPRAEHHLHIAGPLLDAVHPAEGETLHGAHQQRAPGQQVAVQGADQVQAVLAGTRTGVRIGEPSESGTIARLDIFKWCEKMVLNGLFDGSDFASKVQQYRR